MLVLSYRIIKLTWLPLAIIPLYLLIAMFVYGARSRMLIQHFFILKLPFY